MSISRRSLLGVLGAFGAVAVAPALGQSTSRMRIGVIGAGWLGGTVGRLWVLAGHDVMFSSRNPDELLAMTRPLGSRASAGTPQQAAEYGDILLFAVPYAALPQLGRDLRVALSNKIVLDACNPPPGTDNPLSAEAERNGVGRTSMKYLPGTRLVRAFSAVDATAVEASSKRTSGKLGVPIAGDDDDAVQVAARLVQDAGCEAVIVGDLAAATRFQRGSPGFRANTTARELRRLIGLAAIN